jgi:hypothetical protein
VNVPPEHPVELDVQSEILPLVLCVRAPLGAFAEPEKFAPDAAMAKTKPPIVHVVLTELPAVLLVPCGVVEVNPVAVLTMISTCRAPNAEERFTITESLPLTVTVPA